MKVLITVRESTSTSNPYVDLLEASLGSAVTASRFTYARAVFGDYDLLHVQWPEYVFRGSTPLKAVVKAVPGIALLLRLWLFSIPVVATIHNVGAHEPPGFLERLQVALLERLTLLKIYLNESPANDMSEGVVILHGEYPSRSTAPRNARGSNSRALFFGQVRPYKGVEDLITASREIDDVDLEIAGLPVDATYARSLKALASGDASVRFRLEHLTDQQLDEVIRSADLVVLPYKKMYNSGAVLLALGNGAPVLVPKSGATVALAQEVGDRWVTLFDSPVTKDDVERAREAILRLGAHETPNLSRRDRDTVGLLHKRLYETVLATRVRGHRHQWRSDALRSVRADDGFTIHSRLNVPPSSP